MKRIIKISELPRFMVCAPSVPATSKTEPLRIKTISDPANLGRAVHYAMKEIITPPTETDPLSISEIGAGHQVPEVMFNDLERLTAYGRKAWNDKISAYFPFPKTEREICLDIGEGVTIVGHPDLYDDTLPLETRILDWKTNRDEVFSYIDQLKGYALGLSGMEPKEKYIGILVWLRDVDMDVFEFSHGEISRFREEIIDQATKYSRDYVVGDHCFFCPYKYGCKAHSQMITTTAGALVGENFPDLDKLAPVLDEKYEQIQAVAKACKLVLDRIKAHIIDNGDLEFPDPDRGVTKTLGIQTRSTRKIDTEKAYQYVIENFPEESIYNSMTFSLPKLQNAKADLAERGAKKDAKQGVIDTLTDLGALTITESKVLKLWETRDHDNKKQ